MVKKEKNRVLVLTGPTASGKSVLAMGWAAEQNGAIINADAMQMYGDLRILSARPSVEEEATVPHALYGVLDAAEAGNVTGWLALAVPAIRECWGAGRLPILVGGTGMYLKSLMTGLSPIPDVSPAIRSEVRERMAQEGKGALYPWLASLDPVMAARLKPGDTQRLTRALEVILGTGKSLAEWQGMAAEPPLPEAEFTLHLHTLPRADLYYRIDRRVEIMLEQGALEEVKRLKERNLSPDLPLMRAHGVPEFIRYLEGALSLEAAIEKTRQNTRNYAKRQETWMRHQFT